MAANPNRMFGAANADPIARRGNCQLDGVTWEQFAEVRA
jgi:hypothetical protein